MTDLHYFIADIHLGHGRVIQMDGRPWTDIKTHDADMAANCAADGASNRTLWLVGDVAQRRQDLHAFMEVVRPAWGRIILIRGNHDDRVAWRHREVFDEAHEARYLRIDKQTRVYISHYAHRTWRNSHHGAFHVHGHSHGALPRLGRSMDVGAPCIGYRPICLTEVVSILEGAPNTNHH